MVDALRLQELLSRITDRIAILASYAAEAGDDLAGDRVRMGDLKYTFLTALEACIDAAQHVVADLGLAVPATNADSFRSLAGAGILEPDLAATMAGAVGFRNVLVHGYAEVDDTRVVDNLDRLDDLSRFVTAMTALLDG